MITNLRMDLFQALPATRPPQQRHKAVCPQLADTGPAPGHDTNSPWGHSFCLQLNYSIDRTFFLTFVPVF